MSGMTKDDKINWSNKDYFSTMIHINSSYGFNIVGLILYNKSKTYIDNTSYIFCNKLGIVGEK